MGSTYGEIKGRGNLEEGGHGENAKHGKHGGNSCLRLGRMHGEKGQHGGHGDVTAHEAKCAKKSRNSEYRNVLQIS